MTARRRQKKRRREVAIFWLIASVTALGAAILIARPLLFSRAAENAPDDKLAFDVDEQINSIRRDLDCGLIDASVAAAAEREAERKLSPASVSIARTSRFGRMSAFAALGAAPLAAVLLYLNLGTPEALTMAGDAFAARGPSGVDASQVAISSLEERVRTSPNDFASWMALGDAYAASNRAADASSAFSRAAELNVDDADAHSALGEALVLQSNGAITAEAREAFARALELSPADPRARYYLAESRYQVGAVEEAAKAWARLLNDAPADAPWFAAVAARMNAAAAEAGLATSALDLGEDTRRRLVQADAPPADQEVPGGSLAGQADAIAALPADEQRQMIESMVAGLAERLKTNPDNPEGWRMLGRSYRVLGRPEESAAAWKELQNRGAAGAEDWRQYAFALMDMRPEGDESVSAELEAALVKLQSFSPDDPLALYILGHAARNRGDMARALKLWTRLQETLPPDTPLAPTLERLISETR